MKTRNEAAIEKISNGRKICAAAAGASGDAAGACRLPDGSLAFILSDGMGKGMKAAAESGAAVSRLRKLLKAGVPVDAAIKAVNRELLKASGSDYSFATLDLAVIDRESGRARFYKLGAALSFVIRRGRVRRIASPALPVGIVPSLALTHVTAALAPGDVIVMVSDGVTEADRSDLSARWLEDFLRLHAASTGPRVLAGRIVEEAAARYRGREADDLSAMVIMIKC